METPLSGKEPNPFIEMFNDPDRAAGYADGPAKFMPGFADVHRMTNVLIRERVGDDANILVHGAGGGLEIDAFARINTGWRFVGVDPAQAMINEARYRLEYARNRVEFHCGLIDSAPDGPFDAATSLLTLHFLEVDERFQTVREIVGRLKPGAPFVVAHCSFPQTKPNRDVWLSRYEAFAIESGADPEVARAARDGVANSIPLLDPGSDERILHDAGLEHVALFYAAFTWRGWVGFAPY